MTVASEKSLLSRHTRMKGALGFSVWVGEQL